MNRIEVLSLPHLRVSVSDFVIIRFKERYALLLNPSRVRDGHRVLTPIGGGVGVHPWLSEILVKDYDFTFERENELRGCCPGKFANQVRELVLAGEGIEAHDGREAREELVLEEALLRAEDMLELSFQLAGYGDQLVETDNRRAKVTRTTLRIMRFYRYQLSESVLSTLVGQAGPVLRFVTEDEIYRGTTDDREFQIAPLSIAMLQPKQTLEPYT